MHQNVLGAPQHLTICKLVLGFVFCLLLYAVLLLQDVFACTVHVAHGYNVCGMWDRPTNKVRTVDRVRVNGLNGW